ncbi:hypothetical protein F8S13_02595 [Chloroflexia bacterium SDU3-3]|nr:hypothetical protein F8S13_02595 [Chloroflexia bacterium SDU3-3]
MSEGTSYIYRVYPASVAQIRTLITAHVGGQGFWFGGVALWLDGAPAPQLQPVTPFATADEVVVAGDFGHAFSQSAEVRWKRYDETTYDVLVLCEHPAEVAGGVPLCIPHWNSQTQVWEDGTWFVCKHAKAMLRETGSSNINVAYTEYLAPNGAVQFQRLREVRVDND